MQKYILGIFTSEYQNILCFLKPSRDFQNNKKITIVFKMYLFILFYIHFIFFNETQSALDSPKHLLFLCFDLK